MEYQLRYYESVFPALEEFREIPPTKLWDDLATLDCADEEAENGYQRYKMWLSPDEYEKLSSTEKFQLALDRYATRKKSPWEIGRDYERYVGYVYEQKGFRVSYTGALDKKEDMGRDLIATNNENTLIIQCKYWRQERTIHEKHIFQLYGTVVHYHLQHPEITPKGVFITSCTLSPLAQECADYLGIVVKENYPLGEYPQVKCNISRKDGQRIYHLPMDYSYDRVVIEPEKGECYAMTVAEAEQAGYRHAYKWNG